MRLKSVVDGNLFNITEPLISFDGETHEAKLTGARGCLRRDNKPLMLTGKSVSRGKLSKELIEIEAKTVESRCQEIPSRANL